MKPIPETKNALVLRTDFSDVTGWESLCAAVRKPVGNFQAYVDFISDPEYDGITTAQAISLIPADSNRTFFFIIDRLRSHILTIRSLLWTCTRKLGEPFESFPMKSGASKTICRSPIWTSRNSPIAPIATGYFVVFPRTDT